MLRLGGGFTEALAEILQHDDKLIAAQASHGVRVAYAHRDARRHLLQKQVALIVSEGIVEHLEIIQIEEQQCSSAETTNAVRQRLMQTIQEQSPIRFLPSA